MLCFVSPVVAEAHAGGVFCHDVSLFLPSFLILILFFFFLLTPDES